MYQTLLLYKKLRKLLNELGYYNKTMIVYNVCPILIVITFHIVLDNNENLFTRLLFVLATQIPIVVSFLVNALASWFPNKNKQIAKLIYPAIICNTLGNNLKVKFKLDDSISTVNNQYIGFYCFNLFSFTKLSFYQFIFGLSVTYIFVQDTFIT